MGKNRDFHEKRPQKSVNKNNAKKTFRFVEDFFFGALRELVLKNFIGKSFTFSCTLFGSTTRKQKNFFCCNKYFWRDLFGTERKVSKFRRMFTGSLSPSLGLFPIFLPSFTCYNIFYNRFFFHPPLPYSIITIFRMMNVNGSLPRGTFWPWNSVRRWRRKILFLMNQSIIQKIERTRRDFSFHEL